MGTIEKLEQLEKAATRGPWELRSVEDRYAMAAPGGWAMEPDRGDVADWDRVRADYALIAAMRNALPALLAVVEAARERVEARREYETDPRVTCLRAGDADRALSDALTALDAVKL